MKSRKLLSLSLSLVAGAAAAGCAAPTVAPRAPIASAAEFRAVAPAAEPLANPDPNPSTAPAQGMTGIAPAPEVTGFITASVDTPLLQANGRPACGNVMQKKDPKTGVTTTTVATTECD